MTLKQTAGNYIKVAFIVVVANSPQFKKFRILISAFCRKNRRKMSPWMKNHLTGTGTKLEPVTSIAING